jgi:hypothetical protein
MELSLTQEAKRGLGTSAIFIARNRFAVLDKTTNTIQIRNLQNEITKKVLAPCATTDAIFYAGTGMLLCRMEDKVGWWICGPNNCHLCLVRAGPLSTLLSAVLSHHVAGWAAM